MPTVSEILARLAEIANDQIEIAIAWHVALLIAIVALVAGWRPSTRTARSLLVLPLASVSLVGFAYRNPFNGLVFAALSVALFVIGRRADSAPVELGPRWSVIAGALLVALGWSYPHFLEERPAYSYLYAAPLGLIPCPTLAAVTGLALLGGGLGSRGFSLVLAAAGVFFGITGVAQLGVALDLVLLAGAITLAATSSRSVGRTSGRGMTARAS